MGTNIHARICIDFTARRRHHGNELRSFIARPMRVSRVVIKISLLHVLGVDRRQHVACQVIHKVLGKKKGDRKQYAINHLGGQTLTSELQG